MLKYEEERIVAVRTGTRVIMGTDWPVYNIAVRSQRGDKVRFIVHFGQCNGTADKSKSFKTRREAIAAL